MAQWTLTDNSTGSPVVLTFDWNPKGFDHPGRDATLVQHQTSAPSGQDLLFQGRDKMRRAKFEGAVGTETFYNSLDTWKDKWYPLVLTDDQGNTWNIIIETWTWKRIKRRNAWRFDYTAQVIVL